MLKGSCEDDEVGDATAIVRWIMLMGVGNEEDGKESVGVAVEAEVVSLIGVLVMADPASCLVTGLKVAGAAGVVVPEGLR
mmetsp:Transcript_80566/g.152129  ORF Transcript_80566/g.152129 Transcript_80566/m.152129 type:complete len:80 (-) Transcript_80566:71-310(-)